MTEFETKTDMIDVTTMPRFTTVHKVTGKEIPLVYRGEYWCPDCADLHSEHTFDKRFNPLNFVEKWIGGGLYREYVEGLTSFYIDRQQVTKEEYETTFALEMGG